MNVEKRGLLLNFTFFTKTKTKNLKTITIWTVENHDPLLIPEILAVIYWFCSKYPFYRV